MTLDQATTWASTWRTRSAFRWILLSALAIAVFAPLPYFLSSLTDLAGTDRNVASNYVDRSTAIQTAFYLHVGFGGLALLLSPFQFLSRVRVRLPYVHRVVGRVTLGSILVAGLAGLVLAPRSLAGAAGTIGFGLLALLWVTFATTAFRAIRRRDVDRHRHWMVRTFALTYAAVTLRLWLGLLIGLQVGVAGVDGQTAFARAYVVVPFLAWIPNLVVAELYLRTRAGTSAKASEAVGSGQ